MVFKWNLNLQLEETSYSCKCDSLYVLHEAYSGQKAASLNLLMLHFDYVYI